MVEKLASNSKLNTQELSIFNNLVHSIQDSQKYSKINEALRD